MGHMLELFPFLAEAQGAAAMGRHGRHDARLQRRSWARRRSRTTTSTPAGAPGASRRRRSAASAWPRPSPPAEPPDLIAPFALDRFDALRPGRREGRGLGGALSSDEDHDLPAERAAQHPGIRLGRRAEGDARPADAGDADWADYVFLEDNRAGRGARVVVPRADELLVHRRARHRHRHDPEDLRPLPSCSRRCRRVSAASRLPEPGASTSTARGGSGSASRAGVHEGFAGDTLASALARQRLSTSSPAPSSTTGRAACSPCAGSTATR